MQASRPCTSWQAGKETHEDLLLLLLLRLLLTIMILTIMIMIIVLYGDNDADI